MGSSFWTSFAAAAAPQIIKGLTGEDGKPKGVFEGYDRGTENRFDKYIAERRQDVEAAYNSYKTNFDFWNEAATNLAYAVGEGTDPENTLTGMEFAAQTLRGMTKSQATDLMNQFKALRKEGTNIRELLGDRLNRNEVTREQRKLTANDVAKMQLGGGFKYQEKPFNLRENQSPLRKLLSDTFGLYKETDEAAAKKLMEKQRAGIRGGLVDYDKLAGDTPFGEARQSLSLDPSMLRTKAEVREEQRSIYQTETARILNLNTAEEYALKARERAEENAKFDREQLLLNAKTPQEREAAIAVINKYQYQQTILNANATVAAAFTQGLAERTKTINTKYRLDVGLTGKVTELTEGQQKQYIEDIQEGRTQAMVNALLSVPEEALPLVRFGSFAAGGVSKNMFEGAKNHVQIIRQGDNIAGSAASAYEKYKAGAKAVLGDSYNQDFVDTLAKQYLPPDQRAAYDKAKTKYKEEDDAQKNKEETSSRNASGVGMAVDTTPPTFSDRVAANTARIREDKNNLFNRGDSTIMEGGWTKSPESGENRLPLRIYNSTTGNKTEGKPEEREINKEEQVENLMQQLKALRAKERKTSATNKSIKVLRKQIFTLLNELYPDPTETGLDELYPDSTETAESTTSSKNAPVNRKTPLAIKGKLFEKSRERARWEAGGSGSQLDLKLDDEAKQISEEEYNTQLLNALKKEIIEREGFVGHTYTPTPTKAGEDPELAIGFGFTAGVKPGDKMTEAQALKRLDKEVKTRLLGIKKTIPDFDSFPQDVQVALFSSWYRGSLRGSPDTIDLINKGKYAEAAAEFLNSKEYKDAIKRGRRGIRPRMEATAAALRSMAHSTEPVPSLQLRD